MRVFLLLISALSLSACSLVYKLPTRQGNVIEQKQLDQLKLGMTREQVKYLLGTPVASSPFQNQRWDYLGYYRSPRGETNSRVVSLYFDGDSLIRMEGTEANRSDKSLETPDVGTVIRDEKKDATEAMREDEREPGVVIEQK